MFIPSTTSCTSDSEWAPLGSFSPPPPTACTSDSVWPTFLNEGGHMLSDCRWRGTITILPFRNRHGQKKLFLIHIYSESLPEQVSNHFLNKCLCVRLW
ncbi:unnamed protein product, partial [Nesidiocoris tenuis]